MSELAEIEAIKQLKYRYFRFLDTKQWEEIAGCFTEDATSDYDEGKYAFEGREKIVDFLRGALGRASVITTHHGHHPEIQLEGPDRATGIWYLNDLVIDTEHGTELRGTAFYRDEYVKQDGVWKLCSTGYRRVYEEVCRRGDPSSLRLTRHMFSA